MKSKAVTICGIPGIVWGDESPSVFLCVHGKHSSKEEARGLAEIAVERGHQVLSFDLPEHGQRKEEGNNLTVQGAVKDLHDISRYALAGWESFHLHATSLGVYFSLLAYQDLPLRSALLVSPIVDMERLIHNLMAWSGVSEEMLQAQGKIPTSMGETLDWEYYTYVRENPIRRWTAPTEILYASKDNLMERQVVEDFAGRFQCGLTVLEGGEHWFHTEEQLAFLTRWLEKNIPAVH